MSPRVFLALLAAATLALVACEGMSFDAQVGGDAGRAPYEPSASPGTPEPTRPRTSGSPGWERGPRPVETPIEGAGDETHSVRFETPEPRLAAGGAREVTVALVGPEAFEPVSFLVYSSDATVAEIPAGAVTFEPGERQAVLVVDAKSLPAEGPRQAVITFESIDFARPERFDRTVIVE